MTALAGLWPVIGLLVGMLPGLADHGDSPGTGHHAWSLLDCRFDSAPRHQRPEDHQIDGPSDSCLDEEEDEDTSSWKIGLVAPALGMVRSNNGGLGVSRSPSTPSLRSFLSRSSPLRC